MAATRRHERERPSGHRRTRGRRRVDGKNLLSTGGGVFKAEADRYQSQSIAPRGELFPPVFDIPDEWGTVSRHERPDLVEFARFDADIVTVKTLAVGEKPRSEYIL